MAPQRDSFDSIESAREYIHLLGETIDDAIVETLDDARNTVHRHRDALQLVKYKLQQLRGHVAASSRILNDLRTLRRLLLHERADATPTDSPVLPG